MLINHTRPEIIHIQSLRWLLSELTNLELGPKSLAAICGSESIYLDMDVVKKYDE